MWTQYESKEDQSVNFVKDQPDGGKLEARFVRREPSYFVVYLSSHTGCNKSCRMCHLTATGQTTMTPATIEDFEEQALQVLSYFNENKSSMFGQPSVVHYNWMARGEPLANPNMLNYAYDIFRALQYYADQMRLTPKFKVSTIMPNEVAEVSLGETFNSLPVDLYYSLYSMDPSFRKRFLPKSLDPNYALSKLASYQAQSGRDITLHWAFIEGENDSEKAVQGVLDAVHKHGLRAKFNLVRYNPPSNRTRESSEEVLNRNFEIIHESLGHEDSRIIPRVGFDVKASCGMFVS